MLRRVYERIRGLWLLALREHATPGKLGWAVAIGVFTGCTPLLGFHAGIAMGLATIFRLSRLWALLGSRVSMLIFLPWIVMAEIQLAHRLRTGAWASLFAKDALEHAHEWLLDWCLGTVPVGTVLALALGLLAYALARRRDAVRLRKRAPAPPPSSGSPR